MASAASASQIAPGQAEKALEREGAHQLVVDAHGDAAEQGVAYAAGDEPHAKRRHE